MSDAARKSPPHGRAPVINPIQFGKPVGEVDQGKEVFKVAGGEFKAQWPKTDDKAEGNDTFGETWSSDEVPGGLVKPVNTTAATKSSIGSS